MSKQGKKTSKTLADNRRARFDYKFIDEYVAGIVLHGYEAKSARVGNIDLKGSYVTIKDNEAWLINAHIGRYQHATSIEDYNETRSRKLLLSRRELNELMNARDNKMTIVPVNVFLSHGLIKVRIATARGQKQYDKRHNIKKRDVERDEERNFKNRSQ